MVSGSGSMPTGAQQRGPRGTGMVGFGVLLVIVGGFLAIFAAGMGQTIEKAGTVWCGERAMSPGDKCVTIGGAGGTETYAEVRSTQLWQESVAVQWHPILLTIMWTCLGVGALLFVAGLVRVFRAPWPPGRPG